MQIFTLFFTSTQWTKTQEQLLKFVSYERRVKIDRYRQVSDKLCSLYAALLTRMKISELTKLPFSELRFSTTGQNKPIFLNEPAIHFNFSHSHNGILLCLSDMQEVGADIEWMKQPPFEIMDIAFHPDEIQTVHETKGTCKEYRFFEIWTQKEAYTKRMGSGLSFDMTSINTLAVCDSYLDTWMENEYCCSMSYGMSEKIIKTRISEDDICSFFHAK